MIERSKMVTYFVGLAAVILVYSLFMACWLDSKAKPSATVNTRPSTGDSTPAKGNIITTERVVAASAVVALFIYATQAWFASRQWEATNQQGRFMLQQERAWLGFEGIAFDPLKAGTTLDVNIKAVNTGHTPAATYHRSVVADFVAPFVDFSNVFFNDHMAGSVDNTESPQGKIHVAPGGTAFIGLDNPRPLTQELLDDITQGRLRLIVTARVLYRINDGTTGITRRTFIYDPKAGTFIVDAKHDQME